MTKDVKEIGCEVRRVKIRRESGRKIISDAERIDGLRIQRVEI